jgi:hypothetical protein
MFFPCRSLVFPCRSKFCRSSILLTVKRPSFRCHIYCSSSDIISISSICQSGRGGNVVVDIRQAHQCCLLHFTCINKHDLYCSKFVLIMTRLRAVLNIINNKCCGTFKARSWIIFHLQGKHSTHAWLAKLIETYVET